MSSGVVRILICCNAVLGSIAFEAEFMSCAGHVEPAVGRG